MPVRFCAQLLDERIKDPRLTNMRPVFGVTSVTRRLSTRRFKQSDRRVTQAIAYIRRTACEGVTVPMVAAVMGLQRRMAEIVVRRGRQVKCAAGVVGDGGRIGGVGRIFGACTRNYKWIM